jgi:hypothetical protein
MYAFAVFISQESARADGIDAPALGFAGPDPPP